MDAGVATDRMLDFTTPSIDPTVDGQIDPLVGELKQEPQTATHQDQFAAIVVAVDKNLQYWGQWGVLLSATRGVTESIVLDVPVGGLGEDRTAEGLTTVGVRTCVPAADPDGGDPKAGTLDGSESDPEDVSAGAGRSGVADACLSLDGVPVAKGEDSMVAVVAETKRWVAIATQNNEKGMRGQFTMTEAQETGTQFAYKADSGSWRVGGWTEESETRSFQRTKVKKVNFHADWYARYVWYKFEYCTVGGGPGSHTCWNTWEPQFWTGELDNDNIEQPSYNNNYVIILDPGETVKKDDVKNRAFGYGVAIAGLQLDSQTGYSATTSLIWTAVPAGAQCERRLWATDTYVSKAKLLWTNNSGCN